MSIIGEGMRFIDRGDPSGYDFIQSDLTTDDVWRPLDCSAFVPKGVKAIAFVVRVSDNIINQRFQLRHADHTLGINGPQWTTQVADQVFPGYGLVACNAARVVDYRASNTSWAAIQITVSGWVI